MKRLRVAVASLRAGRTTLDPDASRYIVAVHRLAVGDAVQLFDPASRLEAHAVIVSADKREAICDVEAPIASTRLPRRQVTLLAGLAKADTFDIIVRQGTELGATKFVPLLLERTVRTHVRDNAIKRWERIALEAARQSERGDVPQVCEPCSLDVALGALGPALGMCLDPRASSPLGEFADTLRGAPHVAVLTGPEGGMTEEESAQALDAGFHPVSLGPFIARAETAPIALLGALLIL